MTTPQLMFEALHGQAMPSGPERCFWCGAACPARHPRDDYVSDTFFGLSEVAAPASAWICGGCVEATASRRAMPGYGDPRKTWQFSWVVSRGRATPLATATMAGAVDVVRAIDDAETKSRWWASQAELLRAFCLSPPEPPYAITIAVGGQKHLLYRTPVNLTRDIVTVQFELERVTFRPQDMEQRLALCGCIAAACGKPSLTGRPGAGVAQRLFDYYSQTAPLMAWFDIWQQPLSRLAAYLTPKQETCRNDYPTDR